jgi:hypothetical protein
MTTIPAPVIDARTALRLPDIRWHRPLVTLFAAMVLLAIASAIGLLVDSREVTGLDVWAKPLKFALSTAIYSITLAWLIGQLRRFRRAAWIAGTLTAIALAVELVGITGFAVLGETSHFNISTPLHAAAWTTMALSIVVVWSMTLLVAILLLRNPLGDRARTLAIRAGVVLALIGMALAFLMTSPTDAQLADYQGIAGAHTVGQPDGGAGLPLLGWSTVAGDLRIPHFVGMHALQVLPIAAIALELLAARFPRLANRTVRLRLIAIATGAYAAVVAIVLWQALMGQSIVSPSGPVATVTALVAVATLTAIALTLRAARTPALSASV